MGPFEVSDMAGVDVSDHVRIQLFKRDSRPDPYFVIAQALTTAGRLGRKVGKGFYDYAQSGRTPYDSDATATIVQALAEDRCIPQRFPSAQEIQERLLLSLINVGAEVLRTGAAARSQDIDVAWVNGFGFPRHLGGPMFHADTLGPDEVLRRISGYHASLGHYWAPSTVIGEIVRNGGGFAGYVPTPRP
jgi:3-hydroxyacyl-CoA dehydrogenase